MNQIEVPEGAVDLKRNPESALICPLQSSSFAFLAPPQSGAIARPGAPGVMQGAVAVPCAGARCAFWRSDEKACAVLVISSNIGNGVAAVDQLETTVREFSGRFEPPKSGGMLTELRKVSAELKGVGENLNLALRLIAAELKG